VVWSAHRSTDRLRAHPGACAPLASWCAIGIACLSGVLQGQTQDTAHVPTVRVGTRVRVWERAARDLSIPLTGSLTRITADTIAIRPDGLATPVAVARPAVTHLELSTGPHSGSRSSAAGVGAAIGGLGGGILGIIIGNLSRNNAARLGIYGAIAGAGAGAGIGASLPGEGWRPAVLP
jgi:hypothetical protein